MPKVSDGENERDSFKYKFSLFRSAILYSHFKIVMNLDLVYVFLFVYPGVFYDNFGEHLFKKRWFFKKTLKGFYWDNFSKRDRFLNGAGFLSKRSYLRALRFSEYGFPPEFFLHVRQNRYNSNKYLNYNRLF